MLRAAEGVHLKTQTLNIGNRQQGRVFSKSITHCENKKKLIVTNLKKILSRKKEINFENLYYKKNSSKKIFFQIKKNLNKKYQIKTFYDVI